MDKCPDSIKRLIEHFDRQAEQVRSADYNETLLRIDFVNPMFRELGWDIDNTQGFAEQYREVVHEDRVRVAGANKAPDYSFRIGGVRKFFLETKKPFVNIKQDWEPAYQLRRYGWSAKLAVSILTNFEELAVYDCRVAPKMFDKPAVARRDCIAYCDYPQRWEFIAGTFSKQAVLRGDFDRYCEAKKGRGAQEFDAAFLEEIEDWRKQLALNLALRNEKLDERSLNFAVQRIIDRIIFLRMCEDRGTEHVGQLQALLSGEDVYPRMQKLFRDADARYNSGLFHFKVEKGREEAPDELTPGLEVDDATLKGIVKRLYYPESPYEFTMVSADILGSVYERFLGKVITLTEGHRARIEEKPEVRKAGGVYYTPAYIVDYIVRHTVGKLLESCKSPKDAAKLKVLDPACGSGSFLLGAYQHLLDWHLLWYVKDGAEKWSKGKNATLHPADRPSVIAIARSEEAGAISDPKAGHWALTIKERKRILLDNIYGVDIDYQAVEVTKLSLLLKVLEGETAESLGGLWTLFRERALPDLGKNIQCGNSLIGTDIVETKGWEKMNEDERRRANAFDFEHSFARAIKKRGFDAVIGNPPYGAFASEIESIYLREKFKTVANSLDTFIMFVEQSSRLLYKQGKVGFIIPSGWVSTPSSKPLREFFLSNFKAESFVSLPFDVFEGAYIDTVIFTAGKERGYDTKPVSVDLVVFPHRHRILSNDEFEERRMIGDTSRWLTSEDKEFLITLSTVGAELLGKLRAYPNRLDDFVRVKRGIETYDLRLSERGLKNPVYAFNGVLQRYKAEHGARQFLDYTSEIRESKPWEFFSSPRILLRQVLSRRLRLQACFAKESFLTNQSIQIMISASQGKADLKWLLGILNSRVISWFFVGMNSAARRDDFPKIIIKQSRELPLPAPKGSRKDRMLIERVNSMLELRNKESVAKLPGDKERLRREIDATDRRIDQIVYELYDLSSEEIAIVEAGTAAIDVASQSDERE